MKINIETDSAPVVAALNKLIRQATDLHPAWEQVGEYFIFSTRERFRTGTAPDGTPWAPNSETTIMQFLGGKRAILNAMELSLKRVSAAFRASGR
jgi:hypothetical protein